MSGAAPIADSQTPIAERPVVILGVAEMRGRFSGLGPRAARALIKRMPHIAEGRQVWTTEAHLAEYLAARAIPGSQWPATDRQREPVDEDVVRRAVELIGVLCQRGVFEVKSDEIL